MDACLQKIAYQERLKRLLGVLFRTSKYMVIAERINNETFVRSASIANLTSFV